MQTAKNTIRHFAHWMMIVLVAVSFSCSPRVPERWMQLDLPTAGLEKIYSSTDDNGLYADYAGLTQEELMAAVAAALANSGFTPACEAFDGHVKGFRRDDEELIVKVDLLGPRLGLSVFDENGSDPLIHGVCFGRLHLGPEVRVR